MSTESDGLRKYGVLAVLSLITILNQADRVIMSVAGEAVKIDLKLTDGQLGLLGGLAFTVLYSTMALPIARLADRVDRWKLLSVCVLFWSAMTVACGAAKNFTHLFLARAGVGIGEAGCSPNTHSLIGDYFSAGSRTTAIAVLMGSISLGGLVGAVLGGQIVEHHGWRSSFLLMGAPGIVLAMVCLLVFRDPFRDTSSPDSKVDRYVPTLKEVLIVLFRHRYWRHMFIAAGLVMVGSYSFAQFSAPFFVRRYSLGFGDAGLMYGLVMGVTGAIGGVIGGIICDKIPQWGMARYGWVPAAGLIVSAPLFIIGFSQPDPWMAAAVIAPAALLKMLYMGPTFGMVQELVTARMRATATALLFMTTGLVGGMGPMITGFIIDYRAGTRFASLIDGDYAQLCPGGRAVAGAAEQVRAACWEALSSGTQQALVATSLIMLWAAGHYIYAGILMRREVPASDQTPAEPAAA